MTEGTRDPASSGLATFLAAHSPFDSLAPELLERVAAVAELESYGPGDVVFEQGSELHHLRVVLTGAIEIVSRGRVLDVLREGDPFGYGAVLSGLPAGFTARAARDCTCCRIAADAAAALLSGPHGLRFVARSLLEHPTQLHALAREPARNAADEPVGGLIRGAPVICTPDTPIREAARRIGDAAASAAVVTLADGSLGILTDRDLRTRVVAAGLGGDAPVSAAMSAPAYTCSADRPAGDALLEMLDRGLRHLPVLSGTGEVIGVVEESDLIAVRTRTSFYLRQRIAGARDADELVTAAGELGPMAISLHDARIAAANVMAVYSICVDAIVRRLLELALARRDEPRAPFAWLALGSQARREALPSSDIDSAVVWFEADGDAHGEAENENETRSQLVGLAGEVLAGVRACGLRADDHGVNADSPPFVRSLSSWQRLARGWIADPTQEKALILASVLVDSRPVWGVHTGTPVADAFRLAPEHPQVLRMLARFALSHRPPTRRLRGLVLERGGRIDLKQDALVPILDLARWGAISAGVASAGTPERLRMAADAGTLPRGDGATLLDAFELVCDLRLRHQVAQLRAGETPDDLIDPSECSALMRTQLRTALRAIATIQRRVAAELSAGVGGAGRR